MFLALETKLGRLTGRRIDLVSHAALKPHSGEHVRREMIAL